MLTERPDIVALQAVDQNTGRSNGVDQAAALGKLTGMKAVFSRAIDFDGGGYGNAVLTKLPVRSEETVKLKLFEQPMPRERTAGAAGSGAWREGWTWVVVFVYEFGLPAG